MSEKVQITIKNKVGEKYADLQTKIVTPSKETQVITPDDGYYGLKEVIVSPPEIDGQQIIDKVDEISQSLTESYMGGNATRNDIIEGKEAYVKGKKIQGAMEKYTGTNKIELQKDEVGSYVLNTANKYVDSDINVEIVEKKTTPYDYFKNILDNDTTEGYPYKTMVVFEKKNGKIQTSSQYVNLSFTSSFRGRINDGEIQTSYEFSLTDDSLYKINIYDSMNNIYQDFCYITYYFTSQNGSLPYSVIAMASYIILNEQNKNAIFNNRVTYRGLSVFFLRRSNFKYFYGSDLSVREQYIVPQEQTTREIILIKGGSLSWFYLQAKNIIIRGEGIISDLNINCNTLECDMTITPQKFFIKAYDNAPVIIRGLNCINITDFNFYTYSSYFNIGLNLTEFFVYNIKANIILSISYQRGYNLTYDSIIHTIRELMNVNSKKTLTIGSWNKTKIEDTYVKVIDITEEMIKEDANIGVKFPFVICDKEDEGAMTLDEYVALKNWSIA